MSFDNLGLSEGLLKALADQGDLALIDVEAAILAMNINPDKPNPAQI